MAYRLQPSEPAAAGLHRVLHDELLAASATLASARAATRDKAVHDARRNLKRARSILALAGDSIDVEKKRLRDAGRKLSAMRDAAVIVETFDRLVAHYNGQLKLQEMRQVRRSLVAESRALCLWARVHSVFASLARALARAAVQSDCWPVDLTAGQLRDAMQMAHQRMAKAMQRARRTGRVDDFHDWRKSAKQAWHQGRLTGADVTKLDDLQTALGDLHNLDVLIERLQSHNFDTAAKLARHRRRTLRTQVFELAESLTP